MKKIKEVIVVEGRDDISAVKAAVDAEVIAVHGFSVRKGSNLDKLEIAYKNVGLIVFTDPDYAGEQIRRSINARYPNCKNAYISRDEGKKNGDLGVENASPESIVRALENAKSIILNNEEDNSHYEEFTFQELVDVGLVGDKSSKDKREKLGKILSMGYSNGKQLLSRLNSYKIKKEDFFKCIKEIESLERK